MKGFKKAAAAIIAAVMSISAISAVPASAAIEGDGFGTVSSTIINLSLTAEVYKECTKLSWHSVPSASYYVLKVCDSKDNVVYYTYLDASGTTATFPYHTLGLDSSTTSGTFGISVAPLTAGQTDNPMTPPAQYDMKLTLKYDMSKYPVYGAPKEVKSEVSNGKFILSWTNPNDFVKVKDVFLVNIVEDATGKTVFSNEITDTDVTVDKLKDGAKYTAKIYNKSFSAMTTYSFTFKSDVSADAISGDGLLDGDEEVKAKPLSAPKSFKAKAGDKSVTLTWKKVENADGYRVYKYDEKAKSYKAYKTVKGTKLTVTGLKNGVKYKFRVAAVTYDADTGKYKAGSMSGYMTCAPKAARK